MRTINSDELSEQVLNLIREGKTLKAACAELNIPVATVYRWKGRNTDQFADRYYQACQDRAIAWADEIIEIADDCPPRELDVKRAALKIRARQWLIEKQAPTIFAPIVRINQEDVAPQLESPQTFLLAWKQKQVSEVS